MRNPWIIAQLAVAAVLLVVSVVGLFPSSTTGLAILSLAGSIQAAAVFPGLVVSLVVNALLMGLGTRAPAPSTAQKVLLGLEFLLIALLVLFHFYTDPAGNALGFAILTWPILIALAITITVVALVRHVGRPAPSGPPV